MKDSKGHVKKRLRVGASAPADCQLPGLQEMYLERRGSDPLCQLEESPNYI